MKKAVALLLAVACVLSLAACGGGGKPVDSGEVPTLTWYVHGNVQKDVGTVMDAVNKITEEKIGAKLDLQFIDQPSYTQKMNMMMASNTEYDICFTGYVNTYTNAAERGGLLALDEYLKDMPELWNSIPEYTWETVRLNGNIYAVPNLQIIGYQLGFYTFKDLADKYGLTEKLGEFEFIDQETKEWYLEQIRDNEPSYFPVRFNYDSAFFKTEDELEYEIHSSVTQFFDKDSNLLKIDSFYFDEGYRERCRKAKEWYDKGFIREDVISATDDTAAQTAGKYACWTEKWKPGILQELQQKHGGREIVCYPMSTNLYPSTAPDAMTGISKTSKHPELALKMVELVNTDKELYNLICYGVEGKHYNLDENGRVVYNDEGGYIPKAAWKFGNQFNALLLPGQPDDVWEQTRAMNENAIRSPLLGFNFDQTNVTNQISAVESVRSKYASISKGAVYTEEMYDEMLKELKAAGIDKIKEEVIRQYEEWLKTK